MAQSPLKSKLVLENQFGEVSNNWIIGQNVAGGPLVTLDLSESTESDDAPIRTQAFGADIVLGSGYGSDDFLDPSSAFGLRGFVDGEDLSQLYSTMAGVTGNYRVQGTNASVFPKCGVLGIVGDATNSADAAVMAYMDGDGGPTTARCGFGIMMLNSNGSSHFEYGMDLKLQTVAGHTDYSRTYTKADIRLENDIVVFSGATAPVDGTTGDNFAGTGSFYIARDTGKLYLQSGAITSPAWKIVTSA